MLALRAPRFTAWTLGLLAAAAGCSASPTQMPPQVGTASTSAVVARPETTATLPPSLITINGADGRVMSWPLTAHGGKHPTPISGPLAVGRFLSLAADGARLAIADGNLKQLVTYNLSTREEQTFADPYGTPVDVAIDKNENIYIVNLVQKTANVVRYARGARLPQELTCPTFGHEDSIAIDNEGDVLVNGYQKSGATDVIEMPNGPGGVKSGDCMVLPLRGQPGYEAGLAVDPKTDDLIVFDDPDLCAGGNEGLMTVYSPPYGKTAPRTKLLGGNCAGGVRLSADSTRIFYLDSDVSGSFVFIRQASYPGGTPMGAYFGPEVSGFTTVPNTLPN